jgi:hypothetical protein
LVRQARNLGHDGLVIQQTQDGLNGVVPVGNTYAALKPGTVKSATTGETLFSNPKDAAPVGVLPAMANAGERKGITAYHGSPHDFDKFDSAHIGKGEGAQAYGHGLYFAESEGVARSYKNALADEHAWNQAPDTIAKSYLDAWGSPEAAITKARQHLIDGSGMSPAQRANVAQAVDLLKGNADLSGAKPLGRLYEVRLNAEPEQFLDWDKPLYQQSEPVRAALEKVGVDMRVRGEHKVEPSAKGDKWTVRNAWGEAIGTFKNKEAAEAKAAAGTASFNKGGANLAYVNLGGNNIYGHLDQGGASKVLAEAGIPGIRYLDGMSRDKGEGSANYVIFPGNENLIDIMRKYMNPPDAAPAGLLATGEGSNPQQDYMTELLRRAGFLR